MKNNQEKSQEQIKFENMCIHLCSGFYTECLKYWQSVGAVCKWLQIFGLIDYDRVQLGYKNEVGTVHLWGKIIATYRFQDELKMPVFCFSHEYNRLQEAQKAFIGGLLKYDNPFEIYSDWYKQVKQVLASREGQNLRMIIQLNSTVDVPSTETNTVI